MDPQAPIALALVAATCGAFAWRGACARGWLPRRRARTGSPGGHAPSASACGGCAKRGACADRAF